MIPVRPPHNCNELVSDIAQLLDGELDRHAENRLLEEIRSCPSCQQYYNSHSAYKKTVSTKVTRMCCGDSFKESLRAKIRGL